MIEEAYSCTGAYWLGSKQPAWSAKQITVKIVALSDRFCIHHPSDLTYMSCSAKSRPSLAESEYTTMVVPKNKSYSDPLFSRVREKRAASGRRVFQREPEEIVRTFDMSMRDDGINISIGQRESSVIGIGT